jgi:hypothetical protein
MKKLLGVVIAILLVIIIAVALVGFYMNTIVEKGVEEVGSRSLGTELTLSGVDLSFLGGRLTLSGLQIANPEGFKDDRLFTTSRARVAVQPATLLEDEITIDDITIESPTLAIEQSTRGTNLSAILSKLKSEKPGTAKPGAEGKPEKKYRVKLLRISGAKVTFSSFTPGAAPVTVSLPDIQMENISSEDGTGVTLGKVIERVLAKMIQTALASGEGVIPAEIIGDVTGDLRGLVPGIADTTLDKAKGALEKAGGAIKGLFGK